MAFLKNQPAIVMVRNDKKGQELECVNLKTDWSQSFKNQAESFVDTVLSGFESIASGIDGLENLHFIENIWRHIVD